MGEPCYRPGGTESLLLHYHSGLGLDDRFRRVCNRCSESGGRCPARNRCNHDVCYGLHFTADHCGGGDFTGNRVGHWPHRDCAAEQGQRHDAGDCDGEGDLRQRLPEDGKDELAVLGRRFNHFVIKIQDTIREVGSTTDQVASAAEELSRVANETRQSVQEQGSETDQIASAINEMAATIQQISGNANEVEGAASDADRMAKEGGETIDSAQGGAVNQLSQEMEDTARSINALAEKSNDIQQVLDVIHAVTEQTNLLALNAAIEAARAGEHGRGFSVVADEVRQLAKRSAESADQIREMIDGFVAESKASVERMNNSRKSSEATVERINHATSALNTIVTSVTQIHDQVTQIATAAEQQSQVAEEINQNVVRIVDAAQRSDTGVTQTNEASHELARLGENLRELVGQFKV